MTDELDEVFAVARGVTPEDHAAAARAAARWHATRRRVTVRAWVSTLVAAAAMMGGVMYVQQERVAPVSAAYDTYERVSGDGW